MLTPEEEQRLIAVLGVVKFDVEKRVNADRSFSENITSGTILWLAEKLKQEHDEHVDGVDVIIELEKSLNALREDLQDKEYELKQLQLKIDQLRGVA